MTYTIFLLGTLMGIRHALDVDHVVAITNFVVKESSWKNVCLLGTWWGIGHGATLLAVSLAIAQFGLIIPDSLYAILETSVGAMIVGLGCWTLLDIFRHRHRHAHAHSHGEISHTHPHFSSHHAGNRKWYRSFLVGIVHGMAGSAILMLLVASKLSFLALLLYVLLFGIGNIIGMTTVSLIIFYHIHFLTQRLHFFDMWLRGAVGVLSIIIGLYIMASESGVLPW